MGSNRQKSNIGIAILDKWRIWTYPISPFKKKNCVPITCTNLWKACFSNKKYLITVHTPDTNCESIFFIENPVINIFLKIIGAKNQLPITFCFRFLYIKARNSTPSHTNF